MTDNKPSKLRRALAGRAVAGRAVAGRSAALLATVTVVAAAAGCGGTAASSSSPPTSSSTASSSSSASASTGTVANITWQTMWSGNTLTLLNQMVTEFNSTHPNIHVTESNIPSATGDAKLLSEIAAGDPPDVFTEWNPVLGEYAADGIDPADDPVPDRHVRRPGEVGVPDRAAGRRVQGHAVRAADVDELLGALLQQVHAEGGRHLLAAHHAGAALRRPGQGVEDLRQQARARSASTRTTTRASSTSAASSARSTASTRPGKYNLASCPGAQTEANFFAQYDSYPYSGRRRPGDRVRRGRRRRRRRVRRGQGRVRHGRPLGGRPEHPGHEPGDGRQLRRRGVPRHRGRAEHVRAGQLQHHPQGRFRPGGRVHVHRLAGRLQQRDLHVADRPQGRLDARLALDRGGSPPTRPGSRPTRG